VSKKKQKPKIVTPTEEEMRKYGSGPQVAASEQKAPAPPDEAAAPEPAPSAREGVTELKDKLLRARAELANVQRRAANEKAEAIRYALADFLRDLLPVVDDLERTLEAAEAGGDPQSIVAGARLVYENLLRVFRNHHLERIEAVGQPFDPADHEAVMQQPSPDHPPQTVLQEVQKGYRLHQRLVRPAKVIVAAKPAGQQADPPAEGPEGQTD
jgi:molecular chaperone GrpE